MQRKKSLKLIRIVYFLSNIVGRKSIPCWREGEIGLTDVNYTDLYLRLMATGFQWNYLSFKYKNCILDVRKLYDDRQIHLRIIKKDHLGIVYVHDEYNYEFDPEKHIKGIGMKKIDSETPSKIIQALAGDV